MASLTSRLAGWAAGRLKGEKARKKTMEFIDETGVGKLLSLAGDAALLGGAGKLAGAAGRAVGAKLGIGGASAAYDPAAQIAEAARQAGPIGQIPLGDAQSASSVMASRGASSVARPDMAGMAARARAGVTQMPAMNVPMPPMPRGGMGPITSVPTSAYRPLPAVTATPSLSGRLADGVRGVGRYIAKKPEVAGMALQEYSRSRQAAANRELEREAMQQGQRQFEETMGLRKREEERDVERQRRIAEMLAPLFQRIAGGQR